MANHPIEKVLIPALCAGLLSFCAATASAKGVPTVSSRDVEKDPEVAKNPNKNDLISLTLHYQDLIAEEQAHEKNVAGVDFFIGKLQESIKQSGNDVPRDNILQNAAQARRVLKDAYQDLKKGLTPLTEARDILKEVDEVLQPVVEKTEENMKQVKDIADKMKDTVGQMQADAPQSPDQQIDASPLENIEDQGQYLDPLPDRVKEAADKVSEAKSWLESAKSRSDQVETFREKAAEYDKAATERLGQSRTRGGSVEAEKAISSERVIRNANTWLKAVSERALKLHEEMEKLTEPGKGMDKAVADAQKANSKTLEARDSGRENAPKVSNEDAKIMKQHRREYDAAQDDDAKKAAVAKAEAAKAKAQAASEKSQKATEQAGCPCKKAVEGAKKAKDSMEKLKKKLGDRPKDDLTDLGDVSVNVPAPKNGASGARAGAGGGGGNKKSKAIPPSFRSGLDSATSETMRGQFGK